MMGSVRGGGLDSVRGGGGLDSVRNGPLLAAITDSPASTASRRKNGYFTPFSITNYFYLKSYIVMLLAFVTLLTNKTSIYQILML